MIEETTKRYDSEINNTSILTKNSSGKIRTVDEIKQEINSLKSKSTKGNKKELTEKAMSIKNYIDRLNENIKEAKLKVANNVKLPSVDHDANQSKLGFSKEFMPVSIDSTSAISYILNMTLENQSMADSKPIRMESRKSSIKDVSNTPSNRVSSNKIEPLPAKTKKKTSDTK